jgi:PBP1b-binding outer membrane lipoprotein LpoB
MKYLAAVILAFLLLAGCSKKNEQSSTNEANKYQVDSSDIKATPINATNESFMLEYKFPKGKTYHYRLTTITHDDQTILMDTTMHSNIVQNIIYLIDLTPVSVDKDGVIEFNLMFKSVKLNATANGKEYNYESETTSDSSEIKKYAEYKALTGSDMGLRVSKKGEILDVFRTDKVINNFLELKGVPKPNIMQLEQLKTNMVDGAIKPLLYQIFRITPDHQMTTDSSWTYKQSPSQMLIFKVQNTNTYKIAGLEQYGDNKLAVIDAGLISDISGENKITQQGVSYKFQKPTTSAGGKLYFNLTDGCIQKAKTHTSIDIFYSMEAKGPKGLQQGSKEEVITNNYILERL